MSTGALLSLLTACGPASSGGSPSPAATPGASGAQYAWTQLLPGTSPLPRDSAGTGYDAATDQVIVSGGRQGCIGDPTYYTDTWAWDGAKWTQLHPADSGPGALTIGAAEAYDPTSKSLIMYTHPPGCGMQPITFTWNGSNWSSDSNSALTTFPIWSPNAVMAFDAGSQQMILWAPAGAESLDSSGATQETHPTTWVYQHGGWVELHPTSEPPQSLTSPHLVYDAAAQKLFLYDTDTQAAWQWDGQNWSQLSAASNGPSTRTAAAMAYDDDLGKIVLFGGETVTGHIQPSPGDNTPPQVTTGAPLGDTWTWDGTTWTHLTINGPTPRFNIQMAYDSAHKQLVVFGGSFNTSADGNDTWVFTKTG